MTKRAVIIITSILVAIVTVLTILLGFVFRVRKIELLYDQDFCYIGEVDMVKESGKLKKNTSIFAVERDIIKNNIEKAYPYARVRINISSMTSVKITLSNREPLYYIAHEISHEIVYYILDEDCKILEITTDENKATQYILLDDVFSVTEQTEVGEFLDNKYTEVCTSLYKALYSNAVLNIGEDSDSDGFADEKYLERQDMYEIIQSVKFVPENELGGKKDKLVINTDASNGYGVKLTIIEPQKDLDNKINRAFSAMRTLINLGEQDKYTTGSINVDYDYDSDGKIVLVCNYSK